MFRGRAPAPAGRSRDGRPSGGIAGGRPAGDGHGSGAPGRAGLAAPARRLGRLVRRRGRLGPAQPGAPPGLVLPGRQLHPGVLARWPGARRRARATTNGHVTWTADTSRSARPRAAPPWASKTTQASRARNTAVTAPAPWALRISGCDGARRAVKAGHSVIAAAPSEVQARCCGVEPRTGSGDTAMPMLDRPATISTIRAGTRTPGRPAAVTK